MNYYNFKDITDRLSSEKVAEMIGCEIVKGRCEAKWRGGTNKTSVSFDSDGGWYDHKDGIGGGPIELWALAKFGGTDSTHIQMAQDDLGLQLNLQPINVESEADKTPRVQDWEYLDERGEHVFTVRRTNHKSVDGKKPSKDIKQIAADGTYGVKHLGDLPLYNLPNVLKADTVYVCEGEKAADVIISMGLTATTKAGGGHAWSPHYSEFLRGKNVIILPDNDDVGLKYAEAVSAGCLAVDCSVKIVTLSKIEKGDAWEFVNREGGDIDILEEMVADANPVTGVNVVIRDATSIEDRDIPPPDQIIPGLADRGDKLFIIGSSKAKKSFFTLQMATHIASGGKSQLPFEMDGPKRVLYLNLEIQDDHFERRYQRMVKRLSMRGCILAGTLSIAHRRGKPLSDDEIIATAKALRAEVIIIDPAYKLMGWDEKDLTPMLCMFDRIVVETKSLLVIVHHEKKGVAGDRQGIDRGSGDGKMSRDYDAAILLAAQKDEPGAIVVTQIQRNYAPTEPFTLEYDEGAFIGSELPAIEATTQSMRKKGASTDPSPATIEALVELQGPFAKCEFLEVLRRQGCSARGSASYADMIVRLPHIDVNMTRENVAGGRIMYHTSSQIKEIRGLI
jgi:hypothetical protein